MSRTTVREHWFLSSHLVVAISPRHRRVYRAATTNETVHSALSWSTRSLLPSETASLDAQLLLGHVLGESRAWVLAHGDFAVGPAEMELFRSLITRRADGVPTAYLRGWVEWYDLTLEVSSAVLIPRPETELLLEEAVRVGQARAVRYAVDVGTGSGALAIALARELPDARIDAIDISPDALSVASRNIDAYGIGDRICLVRGSLLAEVHDAPDMIVANLPYLSDEQMRTLEVDVRREPALALSGGPAGVDLFYALFGQLKERGWRPIILLEVDPTQVTELRRLTRDILPDMTVCVLRDHARRDRILILAPDG